MPTTLPETEVRPPEAESPAKPDDMYLENRMPDWFKAPRSLVGVTIFLGVMFLFFSYRPLWHTDLWGHLAYGRWISETGELPTTEPLMELCSGVPFVDTAWLSQLIGYGAHQAFGIPGLQFLYAASVTACLGLLFWRSYRRSGAAWLAVAGCCVFLLVEWQQLAVVRPQLGGLLCYVALLVLLTSRRWRRTNWIIVSGLFVVWANLHGSFLVGLAVLAAFCAGRAFDVIRRCRRAAAVLHDTRVRRYFLLAEIAAVAALLNPYGIDLYAETFSVASNANLADLVEWGPLHLRMRQGQAAALAALALMFLYRFSPRRISTSEVLLLVGFGGAALWISRMIVWWAPPAAYLMVLHGGAILKQRRTPRDESDTAAARPSWAVATIGLVWIFFAYTPFGVTLLHGKPPESRAAHSDETPIGAVQRLNEHPPEGLIFNTYEWGDYLLWAGPDDVEVFVASHAHLVPEEVWDDYMHVINVGSNWESVLERYGVNTVVIDTARRATLIGALRDDDDWQVDYEDSRSVVFVRREPIGR